MERLNNVKQEQKRIGRERNKGYGDYGCWFLDHENNAIISPFQPVKEYIKYLGGLGLLRWSYESIENKFGSIDQFTFSLEQEKKKLASINTKELIKSLSVINDLKKIFGEDRVKQMQALENRIALLVAADKRLLDKENGVGFRCNHCQVALLKQELKCVFCGEVENRSEYKVGSDEVETNAHRYRCNSKPRDSILNAQRLDTLVLEEYL